MVCDLIRERLGVTGQVTAVPLSGGITNKNYLVSVEEEHRWVARVVGARTEELGINRQVEYASACRAAELGFGPSVIAWWREQGVMVSAYCEGETLTPATATIPETLAHIVHALRALHASPGMGGRFITGEIVADYKMKCVQAKVSLPSELAAALQQLDRIETALRPRVQSMGLAPCHNDLLPGNFLRQKNGRVLLLDWEYAGMGDRFFDLGNLAVNLEFDDAACEHLASLYFGTMDEGNLAHLHLMRLCSDMRESMWGYLQAGISDLEEDFMGYGDKHLQRFLLNIQDARFEQWLTAVAKRPC